MINTEIIIHCFNQLAAIKHSDNLYSQV